MDKTVPNCQPRIPPTSARLAVVGEAPGPDEEVAGSPFVGASGRFLRAILANSGISCDQTFFGNITQHRPPNNDIESFDFHGPEITTGLQRLADDLRVFRPNCVLLLGKTAFRAFHPDLCPDTKKGVHVPLSDWRGSVRRADDRWGYKSVATFHPAYILRSYGDAPLFRFDVARAVRYSGTADIIPTTREGILRPTLADVLSFCAKARLERSPVTWDIEGFADDVGITMLSLCTSKSHGIVVPFWIEGRNYWTEEEEVQVWLALAGLLADPAVPKCAHNAFYELFVSAWRHSLVVNNLRDDTMMKHWEVFPELERALAICCSIYTDQPYYKGGRLADSTEVKLRYNLTDSLVTHEVNEVLDVHLAKQPRSLSHYRFNINLIPAYNYIMLRGCRFDTARARALAEDTTKDIQTLSAEINERVGRSFNVKSVVDKRWLLYTKLGYKPYARDGESTKEDVLLRYYAKHRDPLVRLIIRCVRKRTRLSDINKLVCDADGRIRSSYDPVGTNTGRLSSRASIALRLTDEGWDNTGTNLQNVTKDLRCCFVPDDDTGYDFWQVDLSGADGWTVAADLASLGYPAMLDDYNAGIKPSLVLYHMIQEHVAGRSVATINQLPRHELKTLLKSVKSVIDSLDGTTDASGRPADWLYLCCKRVQHGSNYGAQPEKISEVVFGDSDGTIDLSKNDAALYQQLYKLRYQTDHRNAAIRRRLATDGALVSACGIRRQFFNIRNRNDIDDATVREAAAFEPQANTTWATNKALERLWYDPHNRTSRGSLHVEPLLQIHDALAGQYRRENRTRAAEKLREWFTNPLTIQGVKVTIPADGKRGPNWKETKEDL